jgi:L-rhamnose-H+ transport protein
MTMIPNPLLGVLLHAIGGFAAGSFYAPLKKVERWAWESFWLVMGLAAWLGAPWLVAWLTTPRLWEVLSSSSAGDLGKCILFGVLWGLGNLTFGLSVRYLGMALGYAVALGFCMTFGTLVPPIYAGLTGNEDDWAKLLAMFTTPAGQAVLGGIAVCLAGIGLCGWAGMSKEAELTDEQKKESVAEFALGKGFAVATMAGILSACFAFGLAAGKPIAEISRQMDTTPIFSNNAVLVVILIGGFASNATWCIILNIRNGSFKDYVSGPTGQQVRNYFLAALGGVIWYGQFFFYGMGTTKLGEKYDFSSWSIHMAFIIVFSNLWGIVFREWRGTSARTKTLVWVGILTLIMSTIVIGYGNYLAD